MKRLALLAFLSLALPIAGAAADGGPAPGVVDGFGGVVGPKGHVRYVALASGSQTWVEAIGTRGGRVLASSLVRGSYGVPVVTFDNRTEGVSHDGRTLVLASWPAAATRFAILDTRGLHLRHVVTLRGSYSYDALSPDGSRLYLIEYEQGATAVRYRVRAYDVRARRLRPGAVVDRRLWGPYMRGRPVSRATSADGSWVYTLYAKDDGTGFVHALDAAHGRAYCVNLPWWLLGDALGYVKLSLDGRTLVLAQHGFGRVATVDTRSLAVHAVRKPVPTGQITR